MADREHENGRRASNEGGAPGGIERRRTVERRTVAARRPWSGREALLRRLRTPVIGLTVAGAAVPIMAGTQPDLLPEEPDAGDPDRGHAPEPVASGGVEEALAERIGASEADRQREAEVESAVERHGIDRRLSELIYDIAVEENIEPKIAYGLVKTESTFRDRAVSPVGARGLTQVMPRTAAWLVPGTTASDLFDRETNLRLGFRYLDQMIEKYRGNLKLALLAYNRGPGTVDRVLKQGGDPDNGYAAKVMRG
jgi:hypothetical protein